MGDVDAHGVVRRMGVVIGDLQVRLAIAEERAEQAERRLVEIVAEQEGSGGE